MLTETTRATVLGALENQAGHIEDAMGGWKETSSTYKRYAVQLAEIEAAIAEVSAAAMPDEVRDAIRFALEKFPGVLMHRQAALNWLDAIPTSADCLQALESEKAEYYGSDAEQEDIIDDERSYG